MRLPTELLNLRFRILLLEPNASRFLTKITLSLIA